MASQLQTLFSLLGDSEIAERLSPAISLTLVVGFDQEGWEEWLMVSVDDRILSPEGRLYKVLGFTLQNTIIAQPIGLDVDRRIISVELEPMGFRHEAPEWGMRHSTGLIDLVG